MLTPRDPVAPSAPNSVTILHGPRTDLLAVVVIFPTIVATLTFLLLAVSPRGFSASYIATNVGITTLGIFVLVTVNNLLHAPEEANLRPTGVRTWSRLSGYGREAPWLSLEPVPGGWISLGYVTFHWTRLRDAGPWRTPLSVSPAQARAILAHPLCPRAPLPASVLRRLRLPADWEGRGRPLRPRPLAPAPPLGSPDAEFQRDWRRQRTHDVRLGTGFGVLFWTLGVLIGVAAFEPGAFPDLVIAGLCAAIGTIWLAIAWKLRRSIREFGVDPPATV